LVSAVVYDLNLINYIVSRDDRVAMEWVTNNTPVNARFIVLAGRSDPLADPVAEWFPAYSSGTSQNTIQGREWLMGKSFMAFRGSLNQLQSCLNNGPLCVES